MNNRIVSQKVAACAAIAFFAAVPVAMSETADPVVFDTPPPASLKSVTVPEPPNLSDFVADRAAAIRLGKALFWDMQIGSDGVVACATCHFHAGADSRSQNQVSPGLLKRDASGTPAPDRTFTFGPNASLDRSYFPLRKLTNPQDRSSPPEQETNDIVSSQGVFNANYDDVLKPKFPLDSVTSVPDPDGFQVNGLNVRRVEPRHTPSVINAVFNHRNFWDGRAQNEFNGVNQWGDRDPNARVLKVMSNGNIAPVQVRLINSSLASQAVAPVVSDFEMSAAGRTLVDVGAKFLKKTGAKVTGLRPLQGQLVHSEDSVLGPLSRSPAMGLNANSYGTMIQAAFKPEWWNSNLLVSVAPDGTLSYATKAGKDPSTEEYTLIQYNFALFFGLAIQLYESTLVANDTPYDRWREGTGTLTPEALLGLQVFLSQDKLATNGTLIQKGARCVNCHAGPELTDASVASNTANGETRNREGQDLDRGFNNIGVRTTMDDIGVGGKDPWGKWLSVTRMRPKSNFYIAVDGAFKAPGLRNVELTAPYFHNGGYLTLEDVVAFYSRGGDFAPLMGQDGTYISPLSVPGLTAAQQDGLVAFLKSLTDERVRYQRAPFDHPQLFVPDGQLDDQNSVQRDPKIKGQALDRIREIPAVGANGGSPLNNFLGANAVTPVAALLLQNSSTQQVAFWSMNRITVTAGALANMTLPPNWQVVGSGYFKNDPQPDLVLQNPSTQQVAFWLMKGMTVTGGALANMTLPPNWQVVGVGDFNNDSKLDLVLQNSSTQQVAFWLMKGMTVTAGALANMTLPPNWQVVGVGDFNNDSQLDLVLQNSSTQQVAFWLMNGMTVTAGALANQTLPPNWRVAGVGDFNNDSQLDLVLQNSSTQQVAFWLMNGMTVTAGALANETLPPDWRVAGAGGFK